MKKILLNRKPINGPWGGGNLFVKAIVENAKDFGYQVVYQFEDNLDAILLIDPRYDELRISANEIFAYKKKNPNVRIVHRVNECDARKGTNEMDQMLRECSKFTDATVFVSNWMKEYFKGSWYTKEQHVVYNGVNSDFFHKEDVISEKIKLVTHHWSNNPMKGFDVYDKLDSWIKDNDRYEFTYIGRDRKTFKNSKTIGPFFGEELGKQLRKHDIYISASRFDPGPNHIIEALACGIPTFVHADGGGAVEFAGPDAIYKDFDELILKIKSNNLPKQEVWNISWKDCASQFFEIIDRSK